MKVSHIEIQERAAVEQVCVSAPNGLLTRFSHIRRGGTVLGLMAAAGGGVMFQMAGWSYSPVAQIVIAGLGVLAGAMIGAREPV